MTNILFGRTRAGAGRGQGRRADGRAGKRGRAKEGGVEASSDPDLPLTVNIDTNTNMLDILLSSIGESTINDRNSDQEGATTIS